MHNIFYNYILCIIHVKNIRNIHKNVRVIKEVALINTNLDARVIISAITSLINKEEALACLVFLDYLAVLTPIRQ